MKPTLYRARLSASFLLTALSALILLTSCWHPAFDPDISGSEAVIRKLDAPILYFTAEDVEGWEMADAWFLPKDSDNPDTGILLKREDTSLRLQSFSSIDAVNHTAEVDANETTVGNTLGDFYMVQPSPDGSAVAFSLRGRKSMPIRIVSTPLRTPPYSPPVPFRPPPLRHSERGPVGMTILPST